MPKKTTKRTKQRMPRVHEMIDAKTEDLLPVPAPARPFPLRRAAVFILAFGLIALFVSNKGLLVAAVVNGKPIFRWQLTQVMISRFGPQTLDSMISQALIHEEARKAGVTITPSDIQAKETALLQSLGSDVTIDDILKYQGMTKSDFEDQLRLQLTVEKLLGKDIVVSDADIEAYIASNQETMTATDEAGLQEEARQAIFSQQINDKLQTWFTEIKTKAKIFRFL